MRARWRTEMDVCRLQENRAMCGTALENLQRRRPRVLVKREDPTALKVFPLGSSLGGAMLYSLQPCAAARGVIPLFFSWHPTAHQIPQTPARALSRTWACRISCSNGWGQALDLLIHQNQQKHFSAQCFAYLKSWSPIIYPN